MTRWLALMLAVVVGGGCPLPAQAKKKKALSARLLSAASLPRLGGPAAVDVELEWNGKGVLEGRLEMVVGDLTGRLAGVRTHELALAAGKQTVRLLLPPMTSGIAGSFGEGTEVRMRFLGRDRTRALDSAALVVAHGDTRSLVFALCTVGDVGAARLSRLARGLVVDRFDPDRSKDLQTHNAWLAPGDLPTVALDYCAYDALLIDALAFARLRDKQLRALDAWLQAGGSLMLLASDLANLKPPHLRFLNELVEEGPPGIRFTLDAAGAAVVAGAPEEDPVRLARELGRVVLALKPVDARQVAETMGLAQADMRAWRHAAAFLWKVRQREVRRVVRDGRWSPAGERVVSNEANWMGGKETRTSDYLFQPVDFGFTEAILPAKLQLIPIGVLVAILVVFVLAIGPGDYLVLGFLRRRRYTWIVFPIVCVGFTLLTVAISNAYLGSADHRRAVVFDDVGRAGKVLRRNRVELVFPGDETREERVMERALFATIDPKRLSGGDGWAAGFGQAETVHDEAPWLEGRFPSRYTVDQQFWKWTPALNRVFEIAPEAQASPYGWDAVDADQLRFSSGRKKVLEKLFGDSVPPEVVLVVVHPRGVVLHERPGQAMLGRKELRDLIGKLTERQRIGFFGVVNRLAPTGGNTFEDLALADGSGERVLVVVRRDGNDFVVHRRLYRGKS